jgi:hypothetical protein
MESGSERRIPRARTEGLVIRELPDEVLVYDLNRDRAHCLNTTAALVWKHCDGQTGVASMVQLLARECNAPVDEAVVWLALEQLGRTHLLSEQFPPPAQRPGLSRREVLRTLGKAAAVALPVVTSLVVPTASEAGSCTSSGSACTTSAQCCTGICTSLTCQ